MVLHLTMSNQDFVVPIFFTILVLAPPFWAPTFQWTDGRTWTRKRPSRIPDRSSMDRKICWKPWDLPIFFQGKPAGIQFSHFFMTYFEVFCRFSHETWTVSGDFSHETLRSPSLVPGRESLEIRQAKLSQHDTIGHNI